MAKEEDDLKKEYANYSKSEKLNYWESYFYWNFKSSYGKDDEIDHFDYQTLQKMIEFDPNFSEIQEEVILNFVKFISSGNDEEIFNQLKINLKLNG